MTTFISQTILRTIFFRIAREYQMTSTTSVSILMWFCSNPKKLFIIYDLDQLITIT